MYNLQSCATASFVLWYYFYEIRDKIESHLNDPNYKQYCDEIII
nr:MAG TPA: hypothetical protein [Caudoviricetes sp.]